MQDCTTNSSRRRPRQLVGLACALYVMGLIAGCAAQKIEPVKAADPAELALQKSLDRVANLPQFTSGADEKLPTPKLKGQGITVSFQGSADQLLSKIAAARGLAFKVQGPQPFLPLPVHVDLADVTFSEFLADVGHQFGQRADLVLTDKTLEIRYRGKP
ncbi:DotD/TraH family lipoprotein [Pelomonas sp. APW6]|uniref:DotD/TraH family lipoprotein n=1 Tax=Roseateles subflavus TaxID=3053353 RepID=A0ABT7LNH5_9BURK|nr:DotD/TraH family lipoprotein [Pelomonas sp. APW6]MDL5034349.1 DotD/TraH family lipoprotein [Pelomonas sp. APW6]